MTSGKTQTAALISLLVAGLGSSVACSSGSASPDGGTGSSGGSGSSSGSGTSSSSTSSSSGSSTSSGSSSGTSSSGTSSSGGASSGSDASTTPSVCDGAGTKLLGPTDTFIDDFEEAMISPGWSSFNDVMPTQNSFKIQQVAGGAVGTAHSGHYAGMGAITSMAGGFGVGTVYNVAIDPAAKIYCIDISGFDGVSFWAKAATAGSKISLNFVLPQTNAQSMDMMGRPNGGDCNPSTMACYNHPRVTVSLTTEWAQYAVKFSDATGGSAKVGTLIQELAWLSPDSNWDFSLDEIAFYKGTPPTGPVGMGGSSDAGTGGD